jgi:outer membrane murein-binding lipoprotein Lpp
MTTSRPRNGHGKWLLRALLGAFIAGSVAWAGGIDKKVNENTSHLATTDAHYTDIKDQLNRMESDLRDIRREVHEDNNGQYPHARKAR